MKNQSFLKLVISFLIWVLTYKTVRAELQDIQISERNTYIVGYWIQPHIADINIKFYTDGRFEFNDFNTKLNKEELLRGKYYFRGNHLVLSYDDRAKQYFSFVKGKGGDRNWYIKKGGYYLVKQK
jgi:hypothetical protein